jgi:CopG family nickel-responsive transcriptional regulator
MEKITRFGVSIEPDLLKKFDKVIRKKGYTNRSEAIRDIIREKLIKEKSKDPNSETFGTLTIIYDHHTGNLTNKLIEIQHEHNKEILSNTHIHIDHNNCLEVLVLKGKTKNVEIFSDKIKSIKGIKNGELVITNESF